jgi:lipid A oxidase
MPMRHLLLPLALLAAASPAWAEVELSFYGGWQGAPDDGVTLGGDADLPDAEVSGDEAIGDSSQLGLRATWWAENGFGIALDYSHFGIDAGDEALATNGLVLDGLDTFTVNGMRRWEDAFAGVTPYVGAGLGVAVADIEVAGEGSVDASGPAVSWVAGASVPITESWSVFGEYEGTYSQVEGDTSGGGSLEADPVTNSINLGVSFSF